MLSKTVEMDKPVLIIGAGICGLALAHGLKKAGIPFEVYERDEDVDARGQGWAITLHWALSFLEELLEPETFKAIDDIQVDPEVGRNDTGNFLFINLATEEARFKIPPGTRRRVGREKLRRLLLQSVQDRVHWGSKLVDIQTSSDGVTAIFEDGRKAEGSLLVGAEGTNSSTRKSLCPESYRTYQLPVRFVGVAIDMAPHQVAPLRQLDPLLFQGSHPDTGTYLWVSMLDVPATNGTAGTGQERYRVQINLSWRVKSPEDEVADGDKARLTQMMQRAAGFSAGLFKVIDEIPINTPVTEIRLTDWPAETWNNHDGRVTLVGDAAHAMVMYRGEAANHGLLDSHRLCTTLKDVKAGLVSRREGVHDYEQDMQERTKPAVLLSRQACLDAHDFNSLNADSAVLKRRAIAAK